MDPGVHCSQDERLVFTVLQGNNDLLPLSLSIWGTVKECHSSTRGKYVMLGWGSDPRIHVHPGIEN